MTDSCEFAERYYEQALREELTGRSGSYFVPSQPLENELGFDMAVSPGHRNRFLTLFSGRPTIWEIIDRPTTQGITLAPELWNLDRFSGPVPQGQWFSLMLQVKRAQRVSGHNGKHWSYWREPYFRSESIRQPQHSHLCTLETNVRRRAYVRYVSPSFLTLVEISQLIGNKSILENSVFVSPSRLGQHHRWTYVSADRRIRLNRDGERDESLESEAGIDFLEPSLDPDDMAADESFRAHLSELALAARQLLAEMIPEQAARRSAELTDWLALLPEGSGQLVRDYVTVTDTLSALDAAWLVGYQP